MPVYSGRHSGHGVTQGCISGALWRGASLSFYSKLLAHHIKALKLPTILREYEKVARQCAAEGVDFIGFLLRLLEAELIERERRSVQRRIRAARFPVVKSLDTFDFAAFPSLNKMLVLELVRYEYILRRENIIALGPELTKRTDLTHSGTDQELSAPDGCRITDGFRIATQWCGRHRKNRPIYVRPDDAAGPRRRAEDADLRQAGH